MSDRPKVLLRAHDVQAGDAVEFALQRNGDLLFDFLGGVAGILRDDLRRHVPDIRDRLRWPVASARTSRNTDRPTNTASISHRRCRQ